MQNDREAIIERTWRQHWFVVNVLVEIPIIGSFFKKKDLAKAFHAAAKCSAMLAGGTAAMMTIMVPAEDESAENRIAKMATSMAIGMTSGKVIFNVAHAGAKILYHYACKVSQNNLHTFTQNELVETEPLTNTNVRDSSILQI